MGAFRMQDVVKAKIARSGINPSYRLEVLNELLTFGKWLEQYPCDAVFQSAYDYAQHIQAEVLNGTAIDYLEFGVHQGFSFKLWLELNTHPDSRFFGFDSFEGLPEDWQMFSRVMPKGTFDEGGKLPDISDPRATFVKGLFQDSVPRFLETFQPQNPLLIHCDADLYSSTLFVLTTLNSVLTPGSIIMFDQFSSVTHEFRALLNYAQAYRRGYRLVAACEPFYAKVAIALS
jgi:O-methyltransferase